MKSAKGFFILESIVVFSLSSMLMLAGLRIYHECFLTLQRKLLLEEAIVSAEASMYNFPAETKLELQQRELNKENLTIKEVQVCHNGKTIFSLAKAK